VGYVIVQEKHVATGANKARSYDGDYMALGREAEEIVMGFLAHHPDVLKVEDLRGLRVMHDADADCLIYLGSGRCPLAEIKADTYLGQTKNVLVELLRINHTATPEKAGTLGWTLRSPATYFLYWAPSVNRIYQCRADDLRAAFQRYSREQRDKVRTCWINTDSIKSTLTALVPWDYCQKIFTIHEIDSNESLPF